MNKSRSLSSDNILDAESQYHSPAAPADQGLSSTTLSESDSKRTRLKKSMSSDQILRGQELQQLCSNKSKECEVTEDWTLAGFNQDFNNCNNNSEESELPELVTVQKHSLGKSSLHNNNYRNCLHSFSVISI